MKVLFVAIALALKAEAFAPTSRGELKAAVNIWVVNKTLALNAYGAPIGQWDVSKVDDMSEMFCGYESFCSCGDICDYFKSFDDDISGWDVSKVTSMYAMFANANSFNQNLSSFNTTLVTNMRSMFNRAFTFDQDLSSFNTASVTSMRGMFESAFAFNQDLSR